MIYTWIAAILVFLVVEAATVGLVSIWFAFGSLCALIAAALGAGIWIQIGLFIVVSAVVMIVLRPLARKYINVRRKPTNADRVIGMICPVTEDIDNIAGTGAVTVDGKAWTARSANGEKIARGDLVRPVSIQGVKLIVEKVQKAATAV